MPLRTPDTVLGTFRERNTPTFTATVQGNDAVVIPGSALATVTLTIYDEHTREIVNDRNNVDVKANVDENGALTFQLEEADMVILNQERKRERRRIFIEWTWDVDKRSSWEGQMVIENLLKVGSPG